MILLEPANTILHFVVEIKRRTISLTVIAEVAAFERGTAFKDEEVVELTLAEADQKPGQTVVPFQHGLGDTPSACSLYSRFARREILRCGIMCVE